MSAEKEKAPRRAGNTDTGGNQVQQQISAFPAWLQRFLETCPHTGAGVHSWILAAANRLRHHETPERSFDIIAQAVDGCGRTVSEREIQDAVELATVGRSTAGRRREGFSPRHSKPRWPGLDNNKRADAIFAGASTLDHLRSVSPEGLTDQNSRRFLELVFPGDPLICVGKALDCARTAQLSMLTKDLHDCELVVPSPMRARTGLTKAGREYWRTNDNTGPRHYLITEFDSGCLDDQASIIWCLRNYGPLTMVVYSGGKSLHAWWRCRDEEEQSLRRWMEWAVELGADPRMWTRCQFARMPGGWRADKGKRQEVVYFDGKECVR